MSTRRTYDHRIRDAIVASGDLNLQGDASMRAPVWLRGMRTRLADPEYEPTDEELRELSRTAFSEVGARHKAALSRMWQEIAAAQQAEREALGLER